jgi:hypothetical protein
MQLKHLFVQLVSILLCKSFRQVSIFIKAALQKIAESQHLLQQSHFYPYNKNLLFSKNLLFKLFSIT